MQRVALLDGENINHDHDITAMFRSLAQPGTIEGLEVQSGKVTPGSAFIEVVRSGKKITVLYENSADVAIDTTGTKKVFIEVSQSNVDNGINNAENGEGIGEIKTASSYPTSNFLPLASITGGVVSDERIFIKGKNVMRTALPNNAILATDASGSEQAIQELPESVVQSLTETDVFGNGVIAKSGHTITGTLQEDITGIVPVSIIGSRNNVNFVPQLASNNANSNFIVSTSKSYSPSYEGYQAFNDTNNVWYMYTSPAGQWIKMQFSSVRCITSLYARSKDANFSVGWKFQASNDNSTWTDLYTSTNQITTGGGTFSFPNTNFYKYYRLWFPYSIPNNVSMHRMNFTESFSPSITTFYKAMSDTGDFGVVTGFLKGPKNQGDTVKVPISEFSPIKGMSGLTANTIYYLGNIPGTISSSPGSHKRIVGYTLDDPTVLITYNGKYLPGSSLAKDIT